jgi:alkaline phosphatase
MHSVNRRVRRGVVLGTCGLLLVAAGTASASDRALQDNSQAALAAIDGGHARSVILLIGDGMGDSEITIARNYQVGAAGRLWMDRLPLTGAYTTYSVQKDNPQLPDYVTDSAASGTGWATGTKTYNGAISVNPAGNVLPTVLEQAKAAGYATGNVTTAELQDATPAVLASHVVDRDCKGPDTVTDDCLANATSNGLAPSIAEQMVGSGTDVMLGGGKDSFDQTIKAGAFQGQTVLAQAAASGYAIATTTHEMVFADPRKPLLGSFAPGNMDLEWTGPTPTPTNTPAARCAVNSERTATQPHLGEMTRVALARLELKTLKNGKNGKGFFLQIEGASIDKQDHAANPCGQIGETVAFDDAVRQALQYQRLHTDTLVVVTADHGHTSQIVEAGSTTTGVTATLTTHDQAEMTISYATTPYPGSQQHTGTEVRIAAVGPQAANVLGVTDQTDLNGTIRRALNLG